MTIYHWLPVPINIDYGDPLNWFPSVPNDASTPATFGSSATTDILVNTGTDLQVGEWIFTSATNYKFTIGSAPPFGTSLNFYGGGIIVNAGSVNITVDLGSGLFFNNTGSAGTATIGNNGFMQLVGLSTLGSASMTNGGKLEFREESSAGSATIHTVAGGQTKFFEGSTAGNAQFITDAGGTVDLPSGTVGSMAGAGTCDIVNGQVIVGTNNLPGNVSGLIDDEGTGRGSLVKVGQGKLTLSHSGNAYGGGTTIEQGTVELDGIGAAGSGAIIFASISKAKATLAIDNAALAGHVFATNSIDFFGKHDFLDLTGFHFHKGATAKYHPATAVLTVHSGLVTDKLTLVSPHGAHFGVASDHHGGTDVYLVFA
jgi:autotransporter-associated beta strand protein